MKNNPFNRRDEDQGHYSDNRSERDNRRQSLEENRFDDYRASGRGEYGSQGHSDSRGNQSQDRDRQRHVSNWDTHGTYSTSRNYGNMGSYGGAQGFGSSRGGQASQRHYDSDTHYNFDSGHGSPQAGRDRGYSPAGYRAYDDHSDNNRQRRDSGYRGASGSSDDLYGSDTSRRFQGRDQDHYDFNIGRDDSYRSSSHSGNRGYMDSGYDRQPPRGDYGSSDGNYGSLGYMSREEQSGRSNRQGNNQGHYRGHNRHADDDSQQYYSSRDSEFVDRGRKNFFKY